MITSRAHLIQQKWTAERGCIIAVEADAADLNALLAKSKTVSITCYNGPRSFTLAGTGKAIDSLEEVVSGHIMASVAAVCPGIFQMELALDALMSLRSDFANLSFRPELQRMQHYHPLVPDDSKLVWIEATSQDPQRLVWDWEIVATKTMGSAPTQHTSGAFVFRPANDTQLQVELEGYERWVSRKRCIRLLERSDADDVLQGRSIYRGFSQTIDYKELYRHVNIIVGKDDESAGRVTKTHIAEPWLDSILTDCFCQVAGIFVNLMTDRSDITEGGIFVCDGIGRWFRSPKMGPDTQLDHWEVFALHHPEQDRCSVVGVASPARHSTRLVCLLGVTLF
jgi:hypothetical protein